MKYKIEKNTVQETLIIPLYARKVCSELYPNLYRDETAVRLIDEIDYDFSEAEKNSRSLMQRFGSVSYTHLDVYKRQFLGFALGRNGNGAFIRVQPKSWKKMKAKLKSLSSRRHVQSVMPALGKIRVYMRGWLYHRIRMCIWKRILAHIGNQHSKQSFIKRNTGTQRLL